MIQILTTGGTIDKVYFDANSKFEIGESPLSELLRESNIHDGYIIRELMRKDSLELTDDDRATILEAVRTSECSRILITHGTDTMAQTAQVLKPLADHTIVLTGAMADWELSGVVRGFSVLFRAAVRRGRGDECNPRPFYYYGPKTLNPKTTTPKP